MARQRPPTFDPLVPLYRQTEKNAFNVDPIRQLMQRVELLERASAGGQSLVIASAPSVQQLAKEVSRQLGLLQDPLLSIDFTYGQPLGGSTVKGTVSPTSITSTTGSTVLAFNLGPLIQGVPYLVKADTSLASNADPSGFIISLARVGASGSSIEGMRTGTASGERTLRAVSYALVWGTGGTVNIAGRGKTTTGTSSVNDAIVLGEAWPLNIMAFREAA